MGKISVMAFGNTNLNSVEKICGEEIICISGIKSRRRLRRFVLRNSIDRVIVKGEICEFAKKELERCGVKLCTGEAFLKAVYHKLIARAAKMNLECSECTVYDTEISDFTFEVIKCASNYFRHVSLVTQCDVGEISERIIESTGMALTSDKIGEIGIICNGSSDSHRVMVDLTEFGSTTFCDENKNIISADIAEALADNMVGEDVLGRLNLKIYSLC